MFDHSFVGRPPLGPVHHLQQLVLTKSAHSRWAGAEDLLERRLWMSEKSEHRGVMDNVEYMLGVSPRDSGSVKAFQLVESH